MLLIRQMRSEASQGKHLAAQCALPRNLFTFCTEQLSSQKQSISKTTASPCASNKSSAFILAQVADDASAYQTISQVLKRKSQSVS